MGLVISDSLRVTQDGRLPQHGGRRECRASRPGDGVQSAQCVDECSAPVHKCCQRIAKALLQKIGFPDPATGRNVSDGRVLPCQHSLDAAPPHLGARSQMSDNLLRGPGVGFGFAMKPLLSASAGDASDLIGRLCQRAQHRMNLRCRWSCSWHFSALGSVHFRLATCGHRGRWRSGPTGLLHLSVSWHTRRTPPPHGSPARTLPSARRPSSSAAATATVTPSPLREPRSRTTRRRPPSRTAK